MQNIGSEQIIAALGMCIWFIFPFGIFLSVVRQDREALPAPQANPKPDKNEHLKIFEHKKMIYNDDLEEIEIPDNDIADNIEESTSDNDFIHPHIGIGSTHVHHLH